MGWAHAGLVILAVIGGSMGSLHILGLINTSTFDDLDKVFPLYHVVDSLQLACLLVPAPVTIGIIIRRRRLFFEPPDPDRGMSLPAMVAVAVLGLWWLMYAGSIGLHYLDPWIWW